MVGKDDGVGERDWARAGGIEERSSGYWVVERGDEGSKRGMRRGYDDAGSAGYDGAEVDAGYSCEEDAEDAGGGMARVGVAGIDIVGSGVARERGETGESGTVIERLVGAIEAARRSAAASAASLTDTSAADVEAMGVGGVAAGGVTKVAGAGVLVAFNRDRILASRSSRFGLRFVGSAVATLPALPTRVGYAPYAIPA